MGADEEEDHIGQDEDSILDKKNLRILGHPLTTIQQMWIGFFLPAIVSTVIFIANIALDITVACLLFREEHPLLAGATLALIYAPSLTCLISTFIQHPKLETIGNLLTWVAIQCLQSLLFPLSIIYRFATQLFWSIVALTEEDPEREKALRTIAASHPTEMFFFLDSFLNAAPQAILQAYILLSPQIVTTDETGWTLAVSIITSVITLSKTAALYQRFESQRVVGRLPRWARGQSEAHTKALINITQFDPKLLLRLQNPPQKKKAAALEISPAESQRKDPDQPPGTASQISQINHEHPATEEQQQENKYPPKDKTAATLVIPPAESQHLDQPRKTEDQTSQISQDHLATEQQQPENNEEIRTTIPEPIQTSFSSETDNEGIVSQRKGVRDNPQTVVEEKTSTTEEPEEHDLLLGAEGVQLGTGGNDAQTASAYLTPIIAVEGVPLDDRCFWPRIQTPPSSPTADPHMRPRLSINTIKSQNLPAYKSDIPLPVRKPRTKGLHEDEPLGVFAAFNAWFTYLLARVLVIAAFSHFFLWPSIGMIIIHYFIMVAYIWFCNPCPNFWAPLIALIFILCPIEVKVRYKYPRVFLTLFFALVLLEDLATVILWYCGAEWESWWYDFAFVFIIGCHGTAVLNAALYLFMFKPNAKYADPS